MNAWNVYLQGKLIDTVHYVSQVDAEYVRQGLINRDGYHPNIVVTRAHDSVYKITMDAMNNGAYVTIISYVCVPSGTDYISGQTFDRGVFQSKWNGQHHVK